MRTLETVQEQRSKAARLTTVPLVRLQLYSNRDAETVGQTFYFSDRTVTYDYGNAGTDRRFEPWLMGLGELESGIVYIPSADDFELISKRFGLALRNAIWPNEASGSQGERVIEILRETYAIEGATIEASQILVPKITTTGPLDLTAYDGDEHTVFYRGRVARLGPISEEVIQLQCETDAPEISWGRALDPATAAPRDLGMRFPKPYGEITRLPLVGHTVGWATTIMGGLDASSTGEQDITDASGFPTSTTFYVMIGGERITCTDSTATSITISARGTPSSAHGPGEAVIELITEAAYVIADDGAAPIESLETLYVRNPFNGQLVRVGAGYSFTASDTTLESGKTLSTVRFSQEQLIELYGELFMQARVTVQPQYRASGGSAPTTSTTEPDDATGVNQSGLGRSGDWTAAADPVWDYNAARASRHYKVEFGSGLDGVKDVLRWRLTLSLTADNTTSGIGACRMVIQDDIPGMPSGLTLTVTVPATATDTNSGTSDWYTPPAGTHLDDLEGNGFLLYHIGAGSASDFTVTEFGVEAEVENNGQVSQDVEAEAIGIGLGYDLEVYADVKGTVAPSAEITAAATVYGFNDDTNWNVTTGITRTTDAGIKQEGAGSQKLVLAETVRLQCEVADNTEAAQWGSFFCTDADEGSIVTEGSGSLKIISASSSTLANEWINGFAPAVDLTAGQKQFILVDIRVHRNGASDDGSIIFWVGSDGSNYSMFQFPLSDFTDDTWHTVVLDYESTPYWSTGTPVWTAWDYFGLEFNNGSTKVVDFLVYIDNIRTVPKTGYAQKNDVASVDMSSAVNLWQAEVRLNSDAITILESVQIYFDNTAGAGTTPPSPTSYMQLDDEDFGAADTFTLDQTSVSAAGDENAVQTIGILLTVHGEGVYAQTSGVSPTAYIDDLQAASAAEAYDATVGEMMEKPADIFRHWVAVVGGKTVDATSFAAALTNLGSDKLAVDMRQLTAGGWREGASGLGYHSRANLVPKETSSGTVYCLYTAESDYDWPVYDREVTAWQTFAEAGPQGRELYTRFLAHYNFNAAVGSDTDAAYQSALSANEDDNDLTVPNTTAFENAADKYGSRESPPYFFLGIEDEATAKDVFGYYCHEMIRAPRIFLFEGCFWWEIFDLEEDDLIQFTHPWSGATVKARVIGYTKRFASEQNALRCLEVE
jgi:hypothetical protein